MSIPDEAWFAAAVRHEMTRARAMFPALHSAHEAYAVILEEVEEFWDETRKPDRRRDQAGMLHELIQIAAMAQRAAEDLGLIEGASRDN